MATFDSSYSGNIHTGDLVAIANGKLLEIGIYLGKGSGSSQQYYSILNVHYWITKVEEGVKMGKTPYKNHVNNMYLYQMVKISPDTFSPEFREIFNKAMKTLKDYKLI